MNKDKTTIEVAVTWFMNKSVDERVTLSNKYYPEKSGMDLEDEEIVDIYTAIKEDWAKLKEDSEDLQALTRAEMQETTIEVDALEWWGNKLNYVECLQLINKYFQNNVGYLNESQIATIYTAEHPTAHTVEKKEDNSSELQLALNAYFIEHNWNDKDRTESVVEMAENSSWTKGYVACLKAVHKIHADNKLLRDALEMVLWDMNNGEYEAQRQGKPRYSERKEIIVKALEQTK